MEQEKVKLIWKESLWQILYTELGKRGNGKTESGAFLLGSENSKEVIDCIYYDDLEPGCLDRGFVHLTSRSFIQLWDYCYEKNLRVKADIHTHPGANTSQSTIDKENPMIKVKGHIGLIVPHFALPPVCKMDNLGIHEFMGGGFKWKSHKFVDGVIKILN